MKIGQKSMESKCEAVLLIIGPLVEIQPNFRTFERTQGMNLNMYNYFLSLKDDEWTGTRPIARYADIPSVFREIPQWAL